MHLLRRFLSSALAASLVTMPLYAAPKDNGASVSGNQIRHVLLISVDGMHALDVANYVAAHPTSALAELSGHGITYSNARTPTNSDSFPGLLALITGGSQVSHGLFYDVSYNRGIFAPTDPTCSNPQGIGNMMVFDETIDVYVNGVSQNKIDPTMLPNHIVNGKCMRMFPHDAMRANTIFEVVKSQGGRTAWADKHPAYDIANGPSGIGVDDLFTPEITNAGGFDNTVSVVCTAQNDNLKVQAILNEIRGFTHDGKTNVGVVPAVFGMNFQAVSVGEKLETDNKVSDPSLKCPTDTDPTINGQPGGYTDGLGTPTAVLNYALQQTDAALGKMIQALKTAGIYDSTLFIVTAKHGQSPINPVKTNKPGHFADLVFALDNNNPIGILINNAANCSAGPCGFVQDDDIALIWLPAGQQHKTKAVADYLNLHANELFIEEVMSGNELTLKFKDPLNDTRTPDIIVQPIYGTIYTTSQKKNAEHGGFSFGDTNVGLIVSNPGIASQVVKTPVATSQVAATILQALGIDPGKLQAVRAEGTEPLPFTSAE